jgi:hypothetical protein
MGKTLGTKFLVHWTFAPNAICLQVVDDVAATWVVLDHSAGVKGHKRTGLSNALNGSEDHLLTREAGQFWHSLGMSALRDIAVEQVEAQHRAGKLSWTQEVIASLREPFPNGIAGEMREGQEIDGDLSDGEDPWDSEVEDDLVTDDEASAVVKPSGECSATAVVPIEGDTPQEIDSAERFAKRLGILESLKSSASTASMPQVAWHVNREMIRLHKSHHIGSEEAAPPRVLQAFLRRKREAEQEVIVASRKVSAKKRKAAAVIKLIAKKALLAKEASKAKKVKVAVALALLPKKFLAGDLGQGHKEGGSAVHRANRVSMLNRLKLRCPPLDPEWEARWDVFAVRHVRRTGTDHKGAIGVFALTEARDVMEALGKHLRDESGKDLSGGDGEGEPRAFVRFVRRQWRKLAYDPNIIVV